MGEKPTQERDHLRGCTVPGDHDHKDCRPVAMYPRIPAMVTEKIITALGIRIEFGSPNDCWVWKGATDRCGYGQVCSKKHGQDRVHRVSWAAVNGPIPKGRQILHRCDNPPCVNPAHLFLGDRAANMRDMAEKKRSIRHEKNPNAALTEALVREIRALKWSGESQVSIGRSYGVHGSAIGRIWDGSRWCD